MEEKFIIRLNKELNDLKTREIKFEIISDGNSVPEFLTLHDIIIISIKTSMVSIYEGKQFKLRITFNDKYPFITPSFSFSQYVYHPNVNPKNYSFELEWKPAIKLINIIIEYIPKFLEYPSKTNIYSEKISDEYVSYIKCLSQHGFFSKEIMEHPYKQNIGKYSIEDK